MNTNCKLVPPGHFNGDAAGEAGPEERAKEHCLSQAQGEQSADLRIGPDEPGWKGSYLEALENARAELSAVVKQRLELDERICRLRKSIESLEGLCDIKDQSGIDSELPDSMGMSDTIRQIIAASTLPKRTCEISDALVAEGFDPNEYSNMLTVVHSTLRRLERQGEIAKVRFPGGDFWGWTKKQLRRCPSR